MSAMAVEFPGPIQDNSNVHCPRCNQKSIGVSRVGVIRAGNEWYDQYLCSLCHTAFRVRASSHREALNR